MPLSVAEAAGIFRDLPATWWVAGGWAIDAFLGHQSREHGDLDIAVLRRDQLIVQDHLAEWELHAAVGGGKLGPWPAGQKLPLSVHDIWCRRHESAPWSMQLMLEEAEEDQWLYRRQGSVQRSLASLVSTIKGIPYLAVEVQFLYKARDHDQAKNDADWRSCVHVLNSDQRRWLQDALTAVHPGHPWIGPLQA